jgi:hypothetical protein
MSTANYNALAGSPLTRGRIQPDGTTINGTTTLTSGLIDVSGTDEIVVMVEITGAVSGDLAVTVLPVEADNVTNLPNITVPAVQSQGPTFGGAKVSFFGRYDVSAMEYVRIAITNNNAGTQNIIRASWRAAGT